jgi:hypothetical protein
MDATLREIVWLDGYQTRSPHGDHLFHISLRSRCTAMLAGLRTLIQTRQGPDRYVLSTFFDMMPSAPSRQACARPILGDVLVQQDAGLAVSLITAAQQSRQRSLAVEERKITQILAIMLDQVEGAEDRGSSGPVSRSFTAIGFAGMRPSRSFAQR